MYPLLERQIFSPAVFRIIFKKLWSKNTRKMSSFEPFKSQQCFCLFYIILCWMFWGFWLLLKQNKAFEDVALDFKASFCDPQTVKYWGWRNVGLHPKASTFPLNKTLRDCLIFLSWLISWENKTNQKWKWLQVAALNLCFTFPQKYTGSSSPQGFSSLKDFTIYSYYFSTVVCASHT